MLVRFKSENDLRKLAVWWLLLMPVAGFAASGDEFYQRLYQRGMAHFATGDYAAAFTELRNAAFGFVEHVEKFETAQCYAIVAAHRLGRDNDARESLMRIVTAEKVQPHFRTVVLPADVRAEVESVATKLLTVEECTLLGIPTSGQIAKPAVVVPTPTKRPNVAVTAPREKQSTEEPVAVPKKTPPPTPEPQPVVPPKQETPEPKPTPPAPVPAPQPAVKSVEASLAEAQRAIEGGDLGRARSIYNTLAAGSDLSHAASLRVAEGLYRVQDFPGAAKAFRRAGTIGRGEEQYHYYFAIVLYETGHYADAKRELAASLPFITVTADVTRYRAKIEGAIE